MAKYLNAQIGKGAYLGGRLADADSFEEMQTLHIRRPDGYYGEYGYGYGLGVTPDFHGHKMVSHGGSILVSTAYMAFLPDAEMGAILMGNSASLPYEDIAEGAFAVLLGMDPYEAVPRLAIKRRMDRLAGRYEIYKGIESVEVVKKLGMLYLESRTPFAETLQPLIPEDPSLDSTAFYTLTDGAKSPVEFVVHEDGRVDLFVERYCYHKTPG
jgi:CubicO group peptidase (beta-lactamase class C family)